MASEVVAAEDQTELYNAAACDDHFKRNAMINSDLESGGCVSKVRSIDPSCTQILSYDISMVKDNSRTHNSYGSKKNYSPNGPKRQCCSLAVAGQTREVDPFLGFESVFSFL